MRLDWNYHSNSIEGNSLTYGETKSLILHHITADGKPLRDHFEITGHNEALLWVMDIVKSERSINENFIRELHKLILKENYFKEAVTPDGKPTKKEIKVGEYKTEPNHVKTVTGEIFYFAEPHEVKAMMTDLLDWYSLQEENKNTNPIILATEFHYKFIRIHPFDDGNGRMARILMNFVLMKHGYHPAIIKKETKDDYFKALRQADAGNIEPFVNYIAESVYNSLTLMVNAIKGLPFEDDNDVDKQFWMLEQKIKGFGEKINEHKNDQRVLEIINSIIKKIKKKCESQNQKFNGMYESIDLDLYDYTSLENDPDLFIYKKVELWDSENRYSNDKMKLHSRFSTFNRKGTANFSYKYNIEFIFKSIIYSIKSENLNLEFYYDETPNEEQIKSMVDKITQDHIKYIEQQISNNQ